MNSRKIRLPEIIDILTNNVISSQEELSKQLAIRGYIITQATLSRDLKLLKANKIPLYCGQQFSHNAPKPQPRIATTGKPFLSAVNSHYRQPYRNQNTQRLCLRPGL